MDIAATVLPPRGWNVALPRLIQGYLESRYSHSHRLLGDALGTVSTQYA